MVVYRIVCFPAGKCYVGQTGIKPNKRFRQHMRKLHDGTHHSKKLQAAYKKYGKSAFFFEILEDGISPHSINTREIYWINEFNSFQYGFNCTSGGDAFADKHSEEFYIQFAKRILKRVKEASNNG